MAAARVMFEDLLQDVRYAARKLRRSASLLPVTVVTLGLGVGVLTALFGVVKAVLLHPIVVEQDRVVRIWKHDVERGLAHYPMSFPEYRDWRQGSASFSGLSAINYADAWPGAVLVRDQAVRVAIAPVSTDFLDVVHGGPARHGRFFEEADERAGAELAGVVSERLLRRIGTDARALVGRTLRLAGGERTLRVLGIAPAELDYPLGTDIWVPIGSFYRLLTHFGEVLENRDFPMFELVGRLRPGVSLEAARSELLVLEARTRVLAAKDRRPMRVVVVPVLDSVVGSGQKVLLYLFCGALLVFVIAGANVAALLLMRASRQREELAVRVALGASRARLARQALTESLLLGAMGATSGLGFAFVLLSILALLAPGDLPRVEAARLDLDVSVFCAAAALLWVVGFGAAPVLVQRGLQAAPGLRFLAAGARSVRGSAGLRLFTLAQISAAVLVAIGAGLLVRSFLHLRAIDRGFDSENVAVVPLLLPPSRYPDAPSRLAFYQALLPRIAALPGVVAAATVHLEPGTGTVGLSAGMTFEGQTREEAAKNPWASFEPVLPSFFRALGVPIVRGRAFDEADSQDAAPVAIVSESVARRYWPGQDPIGKRVRVTEKAPWSSVVGVAADLRYRELTRDWLTVYFPAPQFFFFSPGSLVVRTAVPPQTLAGAIRGVVRAQEPHVPLEAFQAMDELLAHELSRPRTAFVVTGLFALLAIVLAAIGVYGVVAYEVGQRSRELAVRSALGASPGAIFRAVLRRSFALAVVGSGTGVAAAALGARGLSAVLYGVGPVDPFTFVIAPAALVLIVLLAACLPARQAASADPVSVLRSE
jgi:putative ABC transport system permease protein